MFTSTEALSCAGRPVDALRIQRALIDELSESFGPASSKLVLARLGGALVALVNGELSQAETHLEIMTESLDRSAGKGADGFGGFVRAFIEIDRATLSRMRGNAEDAHATINGFLEAAGDQADELATMSVFVSLQRELGYCEAMLGDRDAARTALETARDLELEQEAPDETLIRWIEHDLAALEAGTFDPSVYLQAGWAERTTRGD